MSALEPGTRVAERYHIVEPLGVGGMGVVYRARDEKLGRMVALKTLPAERLGDRKARVRLLREARAAAALEHPAIAQVYDVGETDDGGAFLVMELVRGKTLRALLTADEISRAKILDVLGQVAAALDHAHAHGVVHRDVKPDNIMVREDGRAALLDFGLVKEIAPATEASISATTATAEAEHLTKEGALIGTLSYLAPEQARGKDVGPRSDQFALATTAYEALAKKLPWDGENVAAVLAQILVDDAPPPSSIETSLPLPVDRVFAQALSKDAAERFESCTSFTTALAGAFADSPGRPAPAGRGGGGSRSWLPLLATAAGMLTIGLVASLLWEPETETPEAPPFVLGADAVIGCPILEASGVEAPTAWLGAMGADLACRDLTWRLGGNPERTRVPAELLGLPHIPHDDFPEDPYGEDEARTRTLEAARALDAYLDGTIEMTDAETHAVLRLMAPGREEPVAVGEGRGAVLYLAVADAMRALAEDTPAPLGSGELDPVIAAYFGSPSVEIALLFEQMGQGELYGVGVEDRCRALIDLRAGTTVLSGDLRRVCTRAGVEGAASQPLPALDRSTPATLALTAPQHAETLDEAELRAIADELARARRAEASPYGRAQIARGEVQIWEQLDESDRARDLLLAAADDAPRDWFLRVHLVRALLRTHGAHAASRALAAWHPGTPEAWRTVTLPFSRNPERALPFLRRAYLSGGALPLHGTSLAHVLLLAHRDEEVRGIAARYSTGGPRTRLAGAYLSARVLITEQRFQEAHLRLGEALAQVTAFGQLLDSDVHAMEWYLALSRLLGRERESADPLVRYLVLAEPHRLLVDQPHWEMPTIALCMAASHDVAVSCLERVREIHRARSARAGRVLGAEPLLEGADRYVEGDMAGAARAWRPLVRGGLSFVRPEAFEVAGDVAARERIENHERHEPDLAGARPVDVRQARRAAREGDHATARELATRVVRSWGAADVPLPVVSEMQALLDELPPAG